MRKKTMKQKASLVRVGLLSARRNFEELEYVEGKRGGSLRQIPIYEGGRRCLCCGVALSIYNPDKLCRPCDGAIERWKLFPAIRSETEREMAPHCRQYVVEKCTKRKKVNNAVGGEVSSGSWARTMGKNMSRKKED